MKYHLSRNFVLLVCALAPGISGADTPGHHPGYLHALTDLRDAHWVLGHPGSGGLEEREQHALAELGQAIEEVQRAAADDGKNLYEHPREDVASEGIAQRLRRVSVLLRRAREDVAQEEDNYGVRAIQLRAVARIDESIRIVEGEMIERERAEVMERERMEHERMEHERVDRERMDRERMDHERMDRERKERERKDHEHREPEGREDRGDDRR